MTGGVLTGELCGVVYVSQILQASWTTFAAMKQEVSVRVMLMCTLACTERILVASNGSVYCAVCMHALQWGDTLLLHTHICC
jgi:hypothetical protein